MSDQSKAARHNSWVLTAAQALGASSTPIVVSLGGLVGMQLSPDPGLATLPVSILNLGLALGTIPAALVMRRLGRRPAYIIGASLGIGSGLLAALGIIQASFLIFCLGTCMAGFYSAYVQSYRFAATDGVSGDLREKVIARVMLGGLAAAIIGPQLVIWTRDALPGQPFAGSFLSQSALAMLAIPILLLLRRPPAVAASQNRSEGRTLGQLLTSPRYMLAVVTGVVSYGLMTFIMTAAPMAMVGHGHSVDDAALGIQWHILAMFGPSFFTGRLMARFGKERVAAVGLVLIGISAVVALGGLDIVHFWGSLILLGLGWNFGFIGATAMVADAHSPEERSKAQGANDFMVFGTVACASFFAGSLLHSSGWNTVNQMVFPAIAFVLVPLVWRAGRKEPNARP